MYHETILNFDNAALIKLLEENDYQLGEAPNLDSMILPFTFFKENVFIEGEGWNLKADITIKWGNTTDIKGNTTFWFAYYLTNMDKRPNESWLRSASEIFNFLNTINVFLGLTEPFTLSATIAPIN